MWLQTPADDLMRWMLLHPGGYIMQMLLCRPTDRCYIESSDPTTTPPLQLSRPLTVVPPITDSKAHRFKCQGVSRIVYIWGVSG